VSWYRSVLGLQEIGYVEGEGWRGVLMLHEPSSTVIELRQHDANLGEPFDARRTGFAGLGFEVESREALEDWQEHFIRLSVDHTSIADRADRSVLTFLDPDAIELEMVYRENHP